MQQSEHEWNNSTTKKALVEGIATVELPEPRTKNDLKKKIKKENMERKKSEVKNER